MALGTEVVDLIGLGFLNDAREVAGVAEVAIVQLEAGVLKMRVLEDMINTGGVEAGCTALDAVHDVAFFKQEFGQVRTVLACDAGNKGDFGVRNVHLFSSLICQSNDF